MAASNACFLHVPKSGGSTVVAALRASLKRPLFHAHERGQPAVPLEYLLSRYSVVAGHFTFAQLSPAILRNTFLFTVLREPVDRAVSLYSYYRSQPVASDLDPRVSSAKAFDLPAFVKRLPDRVSPWSNWQTFVFSGAGHCEQPAAELLPAAIDNLRRVMVVGISNDLDAFIRHVAAVRGWPLILPVPSVNVTPHRVPLTQIDPTIARRLARLNECDRELFATAQQLWDHAKALGPESHDAVESQPPLPIEPHTSEHGTREIVITAIRVTGNRTDRADEIFVGEPLAIRISGYSYVTTSDVAIGIRIDDHLGLEMYGVNTRLLRVALSAAAGQAFDVTFSLKANLAPGIYHVTAAVHAESDHLHRCYHWITNAAAFECRARRPLTFSGICDLQASATCDAAVEAVVQGLTRRKGAY